ncbi:MAG: hypothetical protein H0X39_07610 [Actinobacteria bacterium]|nr:hypothetical protein [Actinomycetota bacterium]
MTDTPKDDPNSDRERLAEEAMGHDPDKQTDEGGPWAKTSSGDADSITEDEDDS